MLETFEPCAHEKAARQKKDALPLSGKTFYKNGQLVSLSDVSIFGQDPTHLFLSEFRARLAVTDDQADPQDIPTPTLDSRSDVSQLQ